MSLASEGGGFSLEAFDFKVLLAPSAVFCRVRQGPAAGFLLLRCLGVGLAVSWSPHVGRVDLCVWAAVGPWTGVASRSARGNGLIVASGGLFQTILDDAAVVSIDCPPPVLPELFVCFIHVSYELPFSEINQSMNASLVFFANHFVHSSKNVKNYTFLK